MKSLGLRHFVLAESLGKVVDDVEGGHGPTPQFFRGVIAGKSVEDAMAQAQKEAEALAARVKALKGRG